MIRIDEVISIADKDDVGNDVEEIAIYISNLIKNDINNRRIVVLLCDIEQVSNKSTEEDVGAVRIQITYMLSVAIDYVDTNICNRL